MIIDAFPFFNEVELLSVRLLYLGPTVDQFLIIESTIDFSGKRRKLVLSENFIKNLPYAEKIKVITWDIKNPILWLFFKISSIAKYRKGLWQIQHFQRNLLCKSLKKYNSDDILIFGDLDEFPDSNFLGNKNNLYEILVKNEVSVFEQTLYYYNLKTVMSYSWRGTVMTKISSAIDKTPKILRKHRNIYPIAAKGWHFSYFGGIEKIKIKINAIADVEKLSKFKNLSKLDIEQKVNNAQDIYNREIVSGIHIDSPDIPSYLMSLMKEHLPSCIDIKVTNFD